MIEWIQTGHDGRAYELVMVLDGMRAAVYRGFPDYARNRFRVYPKTKIINRLQLPDVQYVNFENVKKG